MKQSSSDGKEKVGQLMWINELILGFLGASAGLSVASGVFTVFTAVGLVPRFAEHTDSADHVLKYENMIILGCFAGTLFSLFVGKLLDANCSLANFCIPEFGLDTFLAIVGIFTGIYVGTLAVSIAEMLDAIPIMAHRINLKKGVSLVITGLAIGKLLGSFFYYMAGVYNW